MKKYLLLFLGLFLGFYVSGQSILSSVTSSAGNSVEAGGINISWTLGDLVIETQESSSVIITQGFQQDYSSTDNNAPTDINLSSSDIEENSSASTLIGDFSTTDPDDGDTHSYSLVTGDGSNDAGNSSFIIDGDKFLIKKKGYIALLKASWG